MSYWNDEVKARLEKLVVLCSMEHAPAKVADIRAALERVENYAEQEREIRSEFGWKRDGRALIECLRQRVEHLEARVAGEHFESGGWQERAEAAKAEVERLREALTGLCDKLDNWWYEADPDPDSGIKRGDPHPWTEEARAALAPAQPEEGKR